MPMTSKIKGSLLVWMIAELATLAAAVHVWGWLPTVGLGVATSVLGMMVLRRAGRDSFAAIRRTMDGGTGGATAFPALGLVRVISGVCLLLPGLVSDVVGLLLLTPYIGKRLTTVFIGTGRRAQDNVVDLDPDEWRAAQGLRSSPSCEQLPDMLPGGPKAAHSRSLDNE
jgi:UPF0716 family protein affecting phage T7 exclusion